MSLTVNIADSLGLGDNTDEDGFGGPDSIGYARVGLLLIYIVGNFEIECVVWVGEGWITSPADEQFDLGRGGSPRRATRE